ncbi:ABC transporter substrate-binding protein [Actinomadura sp. NBRC 104425]|uniref:MCE family protein n=1 Tax=Actinomadura sp. NBRC 104425 TaxID=3032204 RepID=UPI0024A44AB3|nr:MCE family protein [Actinomadura sp. NBRC 104425]GLZ12333.1 ABC transporter substrate-binding protein [Actinomadura sp. NBRC 104425]
MRIPFRERNPVPIGLTAFAVIAVALLVALNLDSLPLVNGQRTYTADFAEAAGLRADEEVRIAGVKVGKVTGLELAGDHVKVTFRVDDEVRLGWKTRAAIKIKTLLGSHYLELKPDGTGRLKHIPRERTSTPFEVVPAVSELSERVDKINTQQLAKSFDVLSDTFQNSPDEIQAALQGLRRLSHTVASRDDELHELADRAKDVSQLLADRNQDFVKLLQDGDKLLQEVQARRAVIHQLLVNTVALTQQVNALIKENEAQLGPMLDNLEQVNKVLLRNQDNLDRMLKLYAPFTRQFADVTGTGRWFDAYLQNLLPIPASIQNPQTQSGSTGTQSGTGTQQGGRSGQSGNGQGNSVLPFLP